MVKKSHLLLIVILVFTGFARPVYGQNEVQATVIPYILNVRAMPQADAPVVGQYPGGTMLRVTGREDNPHDTGVWVFTTAGDLSGWVPANYLAFAPGSDLAALPVTDATGTAGRPPALESAALTAVTIQDVNLRNGPGTSFPVMHALPPGMALNLIARSADGQWVQAQVAGEYGWVHVDYLDISGDVASLPAVTGDAPEAVAYPSVPAGVVPTVGPRVREIYLYGLSLGNRPGVFAKIGDSITDSDAFLVSMATRAARLGDYGYLRDVIDHFSRPKARTGDSFANTSLAARGGWTSGDLLNPASTLDASVCGSGESPLVCEYRVNQPSVALIMIGTNDIFYGIDSSTYRAHLNTIVQTSIDMGVIPVLSTIPDYQASTDGFARSLELNGVIREVAASYGVPLWDYWLALQGLPNRGVSADGYHPSIDPATASAVIFSPEGLRYGYTMRNLTALLVLDAVWRGGME
jgi:uncharacterized protein YraI